MWVFLSIVSGLSVPDSPSFTIWCACWALFCVLSLISGKMSIHVSYQMILSTISIKFGTRVCGLYVVQYFKVQFAAHCPFLSVVGRSNLPGLIQFRFCSASTGGITASKQQFISLDLQNLHFQYTESGDIMTSLSKDTGLINVWVYFFIAFI